MDPLISSSPLNQAHMWARKADNFAKDGKFEDAVISHNRAGEFILLTIQDWKHDDNPTLLSCLRLQHNHHIHHAKVLQMKQIQQCNKEARRNRSVKMMNKFVQTRPAKSYIHQGPSIFETNALVNAQDIQQSMKEADSMLQFLDMRMHNPDLAHMWQQKSEADNSESETVVGKKYPKSDKVVIEELFCVTEELREHIMRLISENEWLRRENQELAKEEFKPQKNNYLTDMRPKTSGGPEISSLSCFSLPPLEKPMIQPPPKLSSDSDEG